MFVYLSAFIFTLFFAYLYSKVHNKRIKKFMFLLVIFPFWFISAFRYDVGTDYFNTYVKYYEHTKLGWKPYRTEPLFQLLNNVLVRLNCNVVWLFIITSFIFLFFVFLIIFKYSKNYIVSIIVFFVSSIFFNSLNNVRQYLALSIALYGVLNNNKIKKIIFIIVASMIHLSACLLIIIVFIKQFKLNKRRYGIISILMAILSPFVCVFIYYTLKNTKYGYFFDNIGTGFSLAFVLVNLIYTFFNWYFYDENNIISELGCMQLLTFLFTLCSIILQNEELWMRIIRVFSFSQFLLVPCILEKCKSKIQCQSTCFVLTFSYILYTIYTVYTMGGLNVFPYNFIFNI